MISSEVQRTLVKSPPELWSELSDPESLARHLGELGAIAITRTEPENLVEWEAEGTTGTVEITPSGWGTRVTLTVARELPAPEEASESTGDTAAEAATKAPAEVDDHAEQPAPPETSVAEVQSETPPRPLDERKPAPATEAARRAAGRLNATQAGAAERSDDQMPADEPPTETAPPKRGLFARLFGRRRAKKCEQLADPTSPPEDAVAGPAGEETEIEPADLAAFGEPGSGGEQEPDVSADEPETIGAEEEPATAAQGHASEPTHDCEPVTVEEPAPAEESAADGPAADETPKATHADEASAPRADEASHPATPAADLAAELRAAEEVAAEQVEAVLTAVLDRLGSAHHRPFSRP